MDIKTQPINSSRLEALGYDRGLFILRAVFKPSQATYDYFDVPPEVVEALLAAPSKGTYFGQYITGPRKSAQNPNPVPPYLFAKVGSPDHARLMEAVVAATPPPAKTVHEERPPAAPAPELPPQSRPQAAAEGQVEIIPQVELPDDEAALKAHATSVQAEAATLVRQDGRNTLLVVDTAEACAHAVAWIIAKKAEKTRALEKVATIKIPATQAWKAACAFENEVIASYDAAIRATDQAVQTWKSAQRERERVAAEADRRERQQAIDAENAERSRLAAEESKRQAELLRQAGQHEVAAQVEAAPAPIHRSVAPMSVQRSSIPQVAGSRENTSYPFTIEHPEEVARFYIPGIAMALYEADLPRLTDIQLGALALKLGKVFSEFHTVDEKKIGARVRSAKDAAIGLIPGVTVEKKTSTGSTGR